MPTLQDYLNGMGVDETVKTAGVVDEAELDRYAAELGLDFGKEASEKEDSEEDKKEDKKEEEKKASAVSGLDSIYNSLFPEDVVLSKTAEELKVAEAEEYLGARAFDHFAARFDRRLEKIAAELSGSASVSAPTGADATGNVHKGYTVPQASQTNKPAGASQKIDTTPVVTDEVKAKNEAKTVGHFEQKRAMVMDAAMRKHFLLSQLEG